jgi:hypothetical protein
MEGQQVTVTEITTKQDLSAFARAHANSAITWTVTSGPGGTLIILDHAEDEPERAA